MPGQDTGPGGQPLAQARRAEQNQRQPEYHHSVQVAQGCGQSLQQATQAQALGTQQDAMQKAKDHVLPGRAVPQAGEQKNDHQVTAGAGGAAAAATQRNVQVIPEPAGQGNVPPAPVFPHALGKVGIVEVLGQFQAEKGADTNGHIAVSRKIKVELQHVGYIPQHQQGRRQGLGRHGGYPLVDQRQLVGDQGLFGQTEDKPLDAVAEAVGVHPARRAAGVQLVGLLAVPHDGTGWSMAEEGQEYKKAEGVTGGRYPTGGHIGAVTDGRENVETDAQRQSRGQYRQQIRKQRIDRFSHKARVFENAQHQQVGGHQQCQQGFLAGKPSQGQTAQPVQGGKGHQQCTAPQTGPGKKYQAEQTQHQIACLPGQKIVEGDRQRQKNKQKLYRRKGHTVAPNLS